MKSRQEKKEIKVKDRRMARPQIFHVEDVKKTVTVQPIEILKIGDCEVSFPTPNNVALFSSIASKQLQQAINIHASLFGGKLKKSRIIEVKDDDVPRLFNYLECIQSSVVAIYTAIESFCNIAIPENYSLTVKNQKGVTEIWDKAAVERWHKTSDKISTILPEIFKSKSPKDLIFWADFKNLETIRNDIVHQKTIKKTTETEVDARFLKKLLDPAVFNVIRSGFEIIKFFCEKDTSHAYFPMGFCEVQLKPIVIDSWQGNFELIRASGAADA
ncbi:hypothetical protein [Paraburkholderia sp. RL17-381-BIF-C]|uniref:hypothetical protein n=1 Tax=Paraburkholderia sp. RL17-381-BIF-C TaxID=3031635 RepID=UPI0038BCC159